MSDLISRQAAIDKLDPLFESLAIDKIKALPSAQPEVIRCDECRYYNMKSHRCEPLGLITCDGFWCKQAERKKRWMT